jgi:hypothetical protein
MSVKSLLTQCGLVTALIIDDAYDNEPLPEDIESNSSGWLNFFDDLGDETEVVHDAFPAYFDLSPEQLRQSKEFISVIYALRGKIKEDVWLHLFDEYERDQAADKNFLASLESLLKSLGLQVSHAGRFSDVTASPDIIFSDLFLGAAQSDHDIQNSIERLRSFLKGRESKPPLVFLMSRSTKLMDKKAMFRDEANLLGTMFRVYSKHDLIRDAVLERVLVRLATHYEDALRLAEFLYSWEQGMTAAVTRAMTALRRLDITDYAQIREVLLNFEGQPLGSYVLDVFDRVLQHEIEADERTICAAENLSKISPSQYLAPYISGSPDLQDLVAKSIWQHKRRLKVTSTECRTPVGFGDVLVRTNKVASPGNARDEDQKDVKAECTVLTSEVCPTEADEPISADAFVVLTPACDLARSGAVTRILLLAGEIAELTPKTWTYDSKTLKTPIAVLEDGKRCWIRWAVKDLCMLRPSKINALITSGNYSIAGRLRESNAIELQQTVLAGMGRVGLVAPMPATFPVNVEVWSLNPEGKPFRHDLPTLARDGGICYVGRDKDAKENTRLVMTEEVIDEIVTAIQNLDENLVHQKSRNALQKLRNESDFFQELDIGLRLPASNKEGGVVLRANIQDDDGSQKQVNVGVFIRTSNEDEPAVGSQIQNAGFMLVIRDTDIFPLVPISQCQLAMQEGNAETK